MNQFDIIQTIGSGTFANVFKVRKISQDKYYAMKQINLENLTNQEKLDVFNEIRLLASINSQHIIKFQQAFYDEKENNLAIVMELAEQGDLSEIIQKKIAEKKTFEQSEIWKICYDILTGLNLLHENKIIHRDLKSANLFLKDSIVKIADFNTSKILNQQFITQKSGTPDYACPQIWMGRKYDYKCDIWSLGCILYELCCLKLPFRGQDFYSLRKKVVSGVYDLLPRQYSMKLNKFIRSCLKVDQKQRPSSSELLAHEVFLQMNNKTEYSTINLLGNIGCPQQLRSILDTRKQIEQQKIVSLKVVTNKQKVKPNNLPKTTKLISQNKSKENIKQQISKNINFEIFKLPLPLPSLKKKNNSQRRV